MRTRFSLLAETISAVREGVDGDVDAVLRLRGLALDRHALEPRLEQRLDRRADDARVVELHRDDHQVDRQVLLLDVELLEEGLEDLGVVGRGGDDQAVRAEVGQNGGGLACEVGRPRGRIALLEQVGERRRDRAGVGVLQGENLDLAAQARAGVVELFAPGS